MLDIKLQSTKADFNVEKNLVHEDLCVCVCVCVVVVVVCIKYGRTHLKQEVNKIAFGEGKKLPIPASWPGEFQGLYNPWVCKASDTTEHLSASL